MEEVDSNFFENAHRKGSSLTVHAEVPVIDRIDYLLQLEVSLQLVPATPVVCRPFQLAYINIAQRF